MARPERFELPTFWFVAVAAREVNNLYGGCSRVTKCAQVCLNSGSQPRGEHLVATGEVWWWAQNWAQSRGDPGAV